MKRMPSYQHAFCSFQVQIPLAIVKKNPDSKFCNGTRQRLKAISFVISMFGRSSNLYHCVLLLTILPRIHKALIQTLHNSISAKHFCWTISYWVRIFFTHCALWVSGGYEQQAIVKKYFTVQCEMET